MKKFEAELLVVAAVWGDVVVVKGEGTTEREAKDDCCKNARGLIRVHEREPSRKQLRRNKETAVMTTFQEYVGVITLRGWRYNARVVFRGAMEPENLLAMHVVAADGKLLRPHEALYQELKDAFRAGDATLTKCAGTGLPDWARWTF